MSKQRDKMGSHKAEDSVRSLLYFRTVFTMVRLILRPDYTMAPEWSIISQTSIGSSYKKGYIP